LAPRRSWRKDNNLRITSRWLRPQGRRTAQEIAAEFSTALLRGLIRDEAVRVESPLGLDVGELA